MAAETEYRYNRLTWAEINDAVAMLEMVDEFRTWPITERRTFHTNPHQPDIRW